MFSLAGPAWPDPRKQAFFAEAVERLRGGSRRRERRHHVFAPHPWLELVELVHGGRQARSRRVPS
jgi:hypothetical protein